jgi:hypothetical protein
MINQKIIVPAGQLGFTGGASRFFLPNPRKTSIHQLLLEDQQHTKYAQTTSLDDGVSSLFSFEFDEIFVNVHVFEVPFC